MKARRILLFAIPLAIAIAARLTLSSYFEFEAQEDTVRALTIIEQGDLPLYGIGHVRFLGAALGPLVYYLKTIPYLFTEDPAGEIAFLFLLHLTGMVFAMLLSAALIEELSASLAPSTAGRPGHRRLMGDIGGFAVGILLALSLHSQGLTSHAHPSYYAAAFMLPFLYSFYRYAVDGRHRWLILSGACFGIMTQLYQLTLFSPFLMAGLLVAVRRRPTWRDARLFLIPVAMCYFPYLISEIGTGFWNTRNFFTFQPGPRDVSMVSSGALFNLRFMANILVEYVWVPSHLDLLFILLEIVGLVAVLRNLRHSPAARFLAIFLAIYSLLPALVLGAPRFQLSMPGPHLAIVLGAVALVPVIKEIAAAPSRWRRAAGASTITVLLIASFAFSGNQLNNTLRSPLFYPMRMISSFPIGRTPSLPESRELMTFLRTKHGLGLKDISRSLHSPIAASGFYGHHYLARVVENDTQPGPESPAHIFVVDENFPYDILRADPGRVGRFEVFSTHEPRLLPDTFSVLIDCPHKWCDERTDPTAAAPAIRFFWGCGEFRDLEPRLSVTNEECEALLTAPPHNRTYTGKLRIPLPETPCDGCREILYLASSPQCELTVHLDGNPLTCRARHGHERIYAFATLPPTVADGRIHTLEVDLKDCVPYYFDVVQFTGRAREVPFFND